MPESLDRIHAAWIRARTREEADAAVRSMIERPAYQWRHYLDHISLVQRFHEADLNDPRWAAIAAYEDELYGAVASATSSANGIEDAGHP